MVESKMKEDIVKENTLKNEENYKGKSQIANGRQGSFQEKSEIQK